MSQQRGPGEEFGAARPSGQRSQQPEAPRFVQYARWLWIASAALGFLRSMVQVSDRESLVSGVHAQMPQWTQEQVDSAVNGTIMSVLVLAGAVVALYWALATRLLQGKNWARVVVALIGGVRTVSTVFVLLALAALGARALGQMSGVPVGPTEIGFSLATAVLDVPVLVFLFLPESHEHFSARRRGGTART